MRAQLKPLAQALAATLDPSALVLSQRQLAAVDRADDALATLDARLRVELADHQRPLRLLQTIPGIDFGSACTLLLGAWAGVAPGNNQSAGKRRSGRARKGNPTLRATLAECAHGAVRTQTSQFYSYHRAHAGRLGYKRAILATAHKLLRMIHAVLQNDPLPSPFARRAEREARRRRFDTAPRRVVLGDGAEWTWKLAGEQFPGAIEIVDLWRTRPV